MKEIIELLNERGYQDENDIAALSNLSVDNLYALAEEIQTIVFSGNKTTEYSPYNFYASGYISGVSGCIQTGCSVKRAKEFSLLSCLYSEKAFVALDALMSPNMPEGFFDDVEEKIFKDSIIKEIAVLIAMKEPILNNIVEIIPTRICNYCTQYDIFDNDSEEKIEFLTEYCLANATVELRISECLAAFIIKGIPEITEHKEPVHFRSIDQVKDIISVSENHILTIDEIKRLGIIKAIVSNNFYDGKIDNVICKELSVNYLTNTIPLFEDFHIIKNDGLPYIDNLPSFEIPFIKTENIDDVIKLRNAEKESFIKYRTAIDDALKNMHDIKNKNQMRQLFDDVIYKSFNDLNIRIRNQREGRLIPSLASGVLAMGSLIVGQKLNATSAEINAFLSILGGTGFFSTLKEFSKNKPELRDNNYYFLWKLNNEINRGLKR